MNRHYLTRDSYASPDPPAADGNGSAAMTAGPPGYEHAHARLLEDLPVIVFRLDRALRYLYINRAVRELTGCEPQRFIGRTGLQAGMDPSIWAGFEAACRELIASGTPKRHEFIADLPSGRRFLESRMFPEFGADSQVLTIVGIVTEWSDRKRAQDALQVSEERYRSLIAQVTNYAIFATDLEGRATTWNEGVERLLGWPREEFIGLPPERLFSPEDVAAGAHRAELQRAAQQGCASNDRWLRRKDGTPFFAMGMTNRVVDAAGHVTGFTKVLRDQTAFKRAEDERNLLLESERKARQESEQANRLKDEFLATLSHELRSPLNAIVGWVHVLRRHAAGDSEIMRGLQTIERNARAQTQIVNDLLDMSRIMTGKVHLHVRDVSLNQVIDTAIEAIHPAADAKGIRLQWTPPADVERIRGDPNRLQQVMWNLLTNAVKFTPAAGQVCVRIEREDAHVAICVQDTGVGIAPAFLPFVFDRFRQEDASTTRTYGGLGLGLSIVKSLVELHGGTVHVTSAGEGHGCTFTLRLPLPSAQPVPADSPNLPPVHFPAAENALPRLTGVNALVVDDEADTLVFAGRLLEERGARVLLAIDAQQALELLQNEQVDILVSDIGMANEDGYSLISQVRALADARRARIPAIAVTAYVRAEDRQRLLLAGYQMHITKPVEPQELIAGIASLIGVLRH